MSQRRASLFVVLVGVVVALFGRNGDGKPQLLLSSGGSYEDFVSSLGSQPSLQPIQLLGGVVQPNQLVYAHHQALPEASALIDSSAAARAGGAGPVVISPFIGLAHKVSSGTVTIKVSITHRVLESLCLGVILKFDSK